MTELTTLSFVERQEASSLLLSILYLWVALPPDLCFISPSFFRLTDIHANKFNMSFDSVLHIFSTKYVNA